MNNPLLAIPPPSLTLILGKPRDQLVRYLLRWHHEAILQSYYEIWLADQPASVTMRQGYAQLLIELGRPAEALALLDAIDAEREATRERRVLRQHALVVAGRFAEAATLLEKEADEYNPYYWLNQGDLLRAQACPDEAKAAYQRALDLDPGAAAPVRRLAALALAGDSPEAARGYIDALMLRPNFTPFHDDWELLLAIARAQADAPTVRSLEAQLVSREQEEFQALTTQLKIRPPSTANEPVAEAIVEPAPTPLLPDSAYTLLREQFRIADFRPNQARVIANVLAGHPTLAVMPTGAGKSLTYQLPAMLLPYATVVVSPLIALMKDQLDHLPAEVRAHSVTINSTMNRNEMQTYLSGIAEGHYKLVYIAPERLRQRSFLHALRSAKVSLFVIDEVHCVSLWGQNFRPDYLFIGRALEELGNPPILALTATATPDTRAEITAQLGPSELVSAAIFRPNLHLQVVRTANNAEKRKALINLCHTINGPIIVYARSRQSCEELAEALRHHRIAADFYHAQVSDRSAAQERFMRGQTRVLVATVAFGMGVDKADIRAIIHYNLPQSVEAYYQEAGRAGRDGQPARCILFYAASDRGFMTKWLREEAITRDQLRELYVVVRQLVQQGGIAGWPYGLVSSEALQRELRTDNDILLRVGLSVLERVQLIRRHFDLPRTATLTLRRALQHPDLQQLCTLAGFEVGQTYDVQLLDLAYTVGRAPSELEAQLLRWADTGALRYEAGQREMLLELLPAPANVGTTIDKLLSDFLTQQEERIAAIAAYAHSTECRHRTIATHFAQRLSRCMSACDICAGRR